MPSCYGPMVGVIAKDARRRRSLPAIGVLLGLGVASALGACGRTGLLVGGPSGADAGDGSALSDGATDGPAPASSSGVVPPSVEPPGATSGGSGPGGGSPSPSRPSRCKPAAERCDGVDNDCNGLIDDLPPIPCPGGGYRYCVAGRTSGCPTRCDACLPGTERTCFLAYCKFWGIQTCAADGRGFGRCREADPPPECKKVASDHEDSAALEQCCVDNGYCCLDQHDLDGDGDRTEMLGRCDEVLCQP